MSLLDLVLGYDCNLGCTYCTITPAMRARGLSTGRVVRELRAARGRGCRDVSFTGGEPTIRPDLLGLVRLARELGFRDIKVQSNGLLFATRANVERLVAAGATTFHVSIHSHLEATYERIVRRPGTYPLMVRGLRNLVGAGLEPRADLILMESTYRHLPAALGWLDDLGVRRADLWLVSLTDANREREGSLPRLEDLAPFVAEAFELARERSLDVRSLHLPRCALGAHAERAFDPAAEPVTVVTPDETFELSGSRLTPGVHPPACDGCPARAGCRGLRPDYLARHGDRGIAALRRRLPSLTAPAAEAEP